VASAALHREQPLPALLATESSATSVDDACGVLVRLFTLGRPVRASAVASALPSLGVDGAVALGLVRLEGARAGFAADRWAPPDREVLATCDLRPYGDDAHDWWVASDLSELAVGGPLRPDHVLGIGGASTTLASWTVRRPVDRALDLGTGCGVQSLHLATHARRVVATDVNRRALWLAGLNAELNEVTLDLRDGSLFQPVRGERFDLIVTNPPFVISPATGERLVYRDSGVPGDGVVEEIVRAIPQHLVPGGLGQVLANWTIMRDRPWDERLAEWTEGCEAWVVQREVLDPAAYVELWLKDAGLHGAADYRRRYDTWLSWFEDQGVEAIGFGWINLRATGASSGSRFEEWRWEVEQPLGPEVAAHFGRVAALRELSDEALRATRPRLRADVEQETRGAAGAEHPSVIVLRQQRGLRRARQVDTVEAALAGACDGSLTVAQLLAALEQILGAEVSARDRLAVVRELVAEGFLELG
jgi:methylase of polypeptide subunit release factors